VYRSAAPRVQRLFSDVVLIKNTPYGKRAFFDVFLMFFEKNALSLKMRIAVRVGANAPPLRHFSKRRKSGSR